jgi:hypothetical protein
VALMRTVADILFGVTGQSLAFDAPEGRPSSVTSVQVFQWDVGDDDEDEFSLTGTIEANPNTTTDGASGVSQPNPRNIPLTATTGIVVGRTYLITGSTSLKEWAEVESVTSGDSITARYPLHNDYGIGASFVSTRITASVDDTWAADDSHVLEPCANPMYRVRWVYVVSGTTYVADTYFNLIRYGARHGVTPQDVESQYNGWLDMLPVDHRFDQGRRLIDEAYRTVKVDLHSLSIDDATVAEAEMMDELVRLRVVERTEWSMYLSARSQDQGRHLAARKEYQERLDALLRLASKVPIRDSDGAARVVTALGLTVR